MSYAKEHLSSIDRLGPIFKTADRIKTANDLATADRLNRLLPILDSEGFNALTRVLPDQPPYQELKKTVKAIVSAVEGLGLMTDQYHLVNTKSAAAIGTAVNQLNQLLDSQLLYASDRVTPLFQQWFRGVFTAIPGLEGYELSEADGRQLAETLQKFHPSVANRLAAQIMSEPDPGEWLGALSPSDQAVLQKLIRSELETFVKSHQQTLSSIRNWFTAKAASWLPTIGTHDSPWVRKMNELESATDLVGNVRNVYHKRFLAEIAVDRTISSVWENLQVEMPALPPAEMILSELMVMYEPVRVKNIIGDVATDHEALKEPSVVLYQELIGLAESLSHWLHLHEDEQVTWQVNDSFLPLGRLLPLYGEDGRPKKRIPSPELEAMGPHSVYYLLTGDEKPEPNPRGFSMAGLIWDRRSLEAFLGYPKLVSSHQSVHFAEQANRDLKHVLTVLDSLTFLRPELQLEWLSWYQAYRPSLAQVIQD